MSCQVVLAQFNPTVGDITGNAEKILRQVHEIHQQHQANLIVFPELALMGYPADDLLLGSSQRCQQAITQLAKQFPTDVNVVVGHPCEISDQRHNTASVLCNGEIVAQYHKQRLPNYDVFDEHRYFVAGDQPCVFEVAGVKFGLTICEDLWQDADVAIQAKTAGAEVLISLNASPFEVDKCAQRQALLQQRLRETELPILYVNLVGGQDEVVFDGASMVAHANGIEVADSFTENGYPLKVSTQQIHAEFTPQTFEPIAQIYQACVLGIHDYVRKNGFQQVVLGLSGGIDSALVLAMAVDALGAGNVLAVMLPSPYTSQLSQDCAEQMIDSLGVNSLTLPIERTMQAFSDTLALKPSDTSLTAQNLQARIRGTLLMALTNQRQALLLNTSNKSELAMGYGTLYGDMAGAFSPLKDCYKTTVYALAEWRNCQQPVIPNAIIERPPSAELAPNQTDQDDLPDYPLLDAILKAHIEQRLDVTGLVAQGFDAKLARLICEAVQRNEYKRRQAPPGIKISSHAFGRSRRYPVTNRWQFD